MKKIQIIVLTMLFAISQTVYCSQIKSEYDNLDKYNIDIQETIIDLVPGQPIPADTNGPVVIEEKVVNDYFTSNKVRTLITQETKNGKTIRTTTVSTTKNPTVFTWRNGALAAGAVAAGAAGLAYANGLNLDDINKFFGEGFNYMSGETARKDERERDDLLEEKFNYRYIADKNSKEKLELFQDMTPSEKSELRQKISLNGKRKVFKSGDPNEPLQYSGFETEDAYISAQRIKYRDSLK